MPFIHADFFFDFPDAENLKAGATDAFHVLRVLDFSERESELVPN